jgi:hypothetical protein
VNDLGRGKYSLVAQRFGRSELREESSIVSESAG